MEIAIKESGAARDRTVRVQNICRRKALGALFCVRNVDIAIHDILTVVSVRRDKMIARLN